MGNYEWAMVVLLVGLALAAVLGTLIARDMQNRQLRSWAREDGLQMADRKALIDHYRAKGQWR